MFLPSRGLQPGVSGLKVRWDRGGLTDNHGLRGRLERDTVSGCLLGGDNTREDFLRVDTSCPCAGGREDGKGA